MARPRKPAPKKAAPKKPPAAPSGVTPERVDTVLRLRLDGAQFHDLKAFANDSDAEGKADAARGGPAWNVSDADLWAMIGKADDQLVARAERDRGRAYAVAVARREALYARAVNAGDYGAALGCLKDIAQLQGTYPKVAELVKLVKEQDAALRELEADRDRPRLTDAGGEAPGREGPGQTLADGPAEGVPREGGG